MHRLTWLSALGEAQTWTLVDGVFVLPPEAARRLGGSTVVAAGEQALFIGETRLSELTPHRPSVGEPTGDRLVWQPAGLRRPLRLGDEPTGGQRLSKPPRLGLHYREQALDLSAPVLIGRHRLAHLRLDDPQSSAFHCLIHMVRDGARLLDLGSTNGVFADGTRVHDVVLRRRTIIQIGATRLEVRPEALAAPRAPLSSPAMQRIQLMLSRVAAADVPVLIQGESGVGKDSIAEELHRHSGRNGPLVPINAAAITPTLAGSELFGHVRGAFTGADAERDGAFLVADRGTLFLDEVAELPMATQAELLRVVEQRRVRRVGDHRELPVDVRLVAATHRDLAARVRAGLFRADLYHRLCVVQLTLPPLRDRPEDVEPLAAHCLAQQTPPRRLSAAALDKLKRHRWPGNVRELNNVLRRAAVLSDEEVLDADDLVLGPSLGSSSRLDEMIHSAVLETYTTSGQNVTATARRLGVHRATVYRHLKAAQQLNDEGSNNR